MKMITADKFQQVVSLLYPYHNAAMAFLVTAAVCTTLSMFVRKLIAGPSNGSKLPPGPRPWPLIGSLHVLGAMPHQSLAKLARKYGPLMSLRLGSSVYVVASTPDMAKAFLQTFDNTFASRPSTAGTVHMLFSSTDLAFAPYGPYWKLIRRVCMNHVFHPKRLETFNPIRLEEARDLICRLSRFIGQPVSVRPLVQEAANNIISRMTLGKRYTELNSSGSTHDMVVLIDEIMLLLGVPNVGDFIPGLAWMDLQGWEKRMKAVKRKVQEALGEIIEQRREELRSRSSTVPSNRPEDLLDVLILAASAEQKSNADVQITDDNITAIVLDMYLGGTDTTSITTEWALAELLLNPGCLKKSQEEVESVVGRGRLVEDADIEHLPYLRAVVQETFRLHPPAPLLLPREAMQACSVAGYELPAGTRAYVNVWAIGRDPTTWTDPMAFRPERFVGSDVEEKGLHFELLPFGAGRRRCVGWELGLLNVRLFLARLLQAFNWSPAPGHNIDMTEQFGLTVMMAKSLTVNVSPRLPSRFYV
ncbi:hypothetical protein GOP47_0030202 [Adiantum capillus-veneris]|nr:hypothetical protein GOP47_0030202 [Adiantum capillus-veneris]